MKVVLRLLNFLVYFYFYVSKVCSEKWQKTKTNARYYLLLLFYFNDERIIEACLKKMTKVSSHTALVINNY